MTTDHRSDHEAGQHAQHCESCGMPIETGRYCTYCVTADGTLQDFATRFERMVGWAQREAPDLSRADAERRTVEYMATMPAWRAHPEVTRRLASG